MKNKVKSLVLPLLVSLFFLQKPVLAQPTKPNVILILTDDMGYSDVGCFGGDAITPNLDTLAKHGIRFTQFYSYPKCSPTRACLLTGLYPHQVGISQNYRDLMRNGATIAEVLRENGYTTAMAGKWHLSDETTPPSGCTELDWLNHQCGLNSTFAIDINSYPIGRGFEKHYGIIWALCDRWDPFSLVNGYDAVTNAPADWRATHANEYYYDDAIVENALSYIDGFASSGKPFFLYVAHCSPHWPIQTRSEDISKYSGVFSGGWQAMRDRRYQRQVTTLGLFDSTRARKPALTQNNAWSGGNWESKMRVHAGMIDRIDQNVGRIIARLKARGLYDNTIIFFLSDNGASPEGTYSPGFDRPGETREGQALNYASDAPGTARIDFTSIQASWASAVSTPFRYWKNQAYEGGICSPLIVHWPAGITTPTNAITRQVGIVADIMPTILEAAGITYPSQYQGKILLPLEGKSLMPVFRGDTVAGVRTLYWEYETAKAVRSGNWKAVQLSGTSTWELYNLATDRTEITNVASQNAAQLNSMTTSWQTWYNRVRADETNDTVSRVTVVYPAGGEVLQAGSTCTITWGTNSQYAATDVRIEFYNGTSWSIIVPFTANDGTLQWTVPAVQTTNAARVRVTLIGGGKKTSVPAIDSVAGYKALSFDGNDSMTATFTAPAGITGSSDWTVCAWVYNQDVQTNEALLQWARRGTNYRCAQLNYGLSTTAGLMTNWGTDLAFTNGAPAPRLWHHFAVSYSGGTEKAYLDGVLDKTQSVTLNLFAGDPVRLGNAEGQLFLSGSLAAVQVYDNALTDPQIAAVALSPKNRAANPLIALDPDSISYTVSGTSSRAIWRNAGSLGGQFQSALGTDVTGQSNVFTITGTAVQRMTTAPANAGRVIFAISGKGILLTLPGSGSREAFVYSIKGSEIRRLAIKNASALASASAEVFWDGRDSNGARVSAGLYLIRFKGGSESRTCVLPYFHK